MALLEVEGLETEIRMRHGSVRAVDGIGFSVQSGETVGVVGESGSGKTMAGLSLMRLLPPGGHIVSGSMRFDGKELARASQAEMRSLRGNEIAMVFQDPMTSLNPTMSIGRQIAEAVRLHLGYSPNKAMQRAEEILSLVGVPRPAERLGEYPHQLSGGLRQRVMIAMALSCNPKLVIADEPTTALDVTIQAQILSLLDDLRQQLGMAMLLITHDMGVIAARADRVLVMYGGRVVESALTEELFANPRHPYTEALLGSIPQLHQDRSRPLYSIPGMPPDLSQRPSHCRFAPRCRYAQQRCWSEDPQLSEDLSGHGHACFFPLSPGLGGARASGSGAEDSQLPAVPKSPVRLVPPRDGEPRATPSILRLDGVVKEYPASTGLVFGSRAGTVKAVSGVSLDLGASETFGLVGESGCGKSTIGRLSVALEAPTAGRVEHDGTDVASLNSAQLRSLRKGFQLMFQDPYSSLDPRMRVGSIVAEPLVIQGMGNRAQRRGRVAELLGEVGIDPSAADSYPHEFSGGQRQRIGLARALALRPRLIVADEPVSALDVSIRSQILNLMMRLQADFGVSYLLISHDLSVVRYLADRIGVMYLGKIVESGPAAVLYDHPAHPYTLGMLESIPLPDPTRRAPKAAVRGELPSPLHPPSGCRFRTRCPRAQEICANVEPAMRSFGADHEAACHFPLLDPSPV